MENWITIPKKHAFTPKKKTRMMHPELHDYCYESGLMHFVVFCLRNGIPKDIRRKIYLLIQKNKKNYQKTIIVQTIGDQNPNNWKTNVKYGLSLEEQREFCPNCHDKPKNSKKLSVLEKLYRELYEGLSVGNVTTSYMSHLCRYCYVLALKGENIRTQKSYGFNTMCGTMKNFNFEEYLCGCQKYYTKEKIINEKCSKNCKVLCFK